MLNPSKQCNTAACGAVVSEHEDLALVDLEQHYWPYIWPSTWKPWILFVHVVLTLEPVSPNSNGQPC